MIYSFANYQLDDEALELRGPRGVVTAEPRVLETLIYLVHNRGRVISKEELAQCVWQAPHITDSAIARCIMEARRAIGDDAARPVAIHTVHGRGYRFDATVEELAPSTARAPGPKWRIWASAALTAGMVALVAFTGTWLWPEPTADLPSAVPIPLRIRVEVPPADDELQFLALSLTEDLRRTLDQVPELEWREDRLAADRRRLLELHLSAGTVQGTSHFEVSLLPPGEAAARPPILLARYQIPSRITAVGVDRFVAVRGAVIHRVVQRLRWVLQPAPPTLETHEEAWRLLLAAITSWGEACDGGTAVQQLRRSVELDSDSAPAWTLLATAYWDQLNLCSGDPNLLAEAEQALSRAIALEPEALQPQQLRAALRIYQGRVEEAYTALKQLAARHPESFFIQLRLSDALRYAGFLDASTRVFERAVREHPEVSFLYGFVVPYPALYRDRWESLLQLLPQRGSPLVRYYRGYTQWRRGDPEEARRTLEPAFVDHPGDLFARLCQALLATLEGDTAEARVVLAQLARQRAEKKAGDGEVSFKIGELLILAGATDPGLEQLALAVEQGFFCSRCLVSSPALASLPEDRRLDLLLATAADRHRRFATRFDLPMEATAAAIPPQIAGQAAAVTAGSRPTAGEVR